MRTKNEAGSRKGEKIDSRTMKTFLERPKQHIHWKVLTVNSIASNSLYNKEQ